MNRAPAASRLCAIWLLRVSILCIGAQPGIVWADGAVASSITGMGTATIRRSPDRMRMVIQLPAEARSLKEALEKIAQRKESARKKLTALGVAEQDIVFEDLRPETTTPQQLMEQAMKARMGMGKKAAPPAPGVVRLLVTLKASWPMAGKSPEELLAASQELQHKVKEADLAELKQASAEERERLEEQQGGEDFNFNFGMPATPKPAEPAFSFVARIPDEEVTRATAQAFKTAKAKAEQLARGAGVELGKLTHLSSVIGPETDPAQSPYFQMVQAGAGGSQMTGDDPKEATGAQPTQITMRLTVTVSFGIK